MLRQRSFDILKGGGLIKVFEESRRKERGRGDQEIVKFTHSFSWLAASFLLTAAVFPTYKDLGLPAGLFPATSPHYTVTEISEDPAAPGFLKFHLTTPHGDYEEEGLANLRKTAHEIEVLETLVVSGKKGSFEEGFTESIQDTKVGLKKFMDHPKESFKDMRKAGVKIGHMISEALREKDPGEKTSLS